MKSLRSLLLLMVFPGVLAAQDVSLELTVHYAGKPVPKQSVVLVLAGEITQNPTSDARKWEGVSDAGGVAKFSKLKEAEFRVVTAREFVCWSELREFRPFPRLLTLKAGANTATVELQVLGCTLFDIERPKDPDFRVFEVALTPLLHGANSILGTTVKGWPPVGYLPVGKWSVRVGICYQSGGGFPQHYEVDIPAAQEFTLKPVFEMRKLSGTLKIPKGKENTDFWVRLYDPARPGIPLVTKHPAGAKVVKGKFDFGMVLSGEYFVGVQLESTSVYAHALVNLIKDVTDVKLEFPAKTGDLGVKVSATGIKNQLLKTWLLDAKGSKPVFSGQFERSHSVGKSEWFKGLPEGSYVVEVSGPEVETAQLKVNVKAGSDTEVEVPLQAARLCMVQFENNERPVSEFSWTVEDAAGKPLPVSCKREFLLNMEMGLENHLDTAVRLGIPKGGAKLRIRAPGYEDVVVELTGTGNVEVQKTLDKRK